MDRVPFGARSAPAVVDIFGSEDRARVGDRVFRNARSGINPLSGATTSARDIDRLCCGPSLGAERSMRALSDMSAFAGEPRPHGRGLAHAARLVWHRANLP